MIFDVFKYIEKKTRGIFSMSSTIWYLKKYKIIFFFKGPTPTTTTTTSTKTCKMN